MSPLPEPVDVDGTTRHVDHSAIRTNQAFIIALLILAFVLNAWWLVAFVSVVTIIGAIVPSAGLPRAIYLNILKPLGIVKPDVKRDNPEPHRFAQGLGGAVMLVATLVLLGGATTPGWVLSWMVIVLAASNLFAGMCVGALIYYQLNRLGVPGFTHARLQSRR